MPQSKITLIGLEQFLSPDRSLFEDLELPEGIDLDTLKGTIFLRCNEFEVLYSDPEFMISAISVWGKKNYWTFDRWVKLLDKEYDPLYNKDYHEVWTDTHSGTYQKAGTYQNAATEQNQGNSTDTASNTHSEKAFNSSDYVGITQDSGTNGNQFINSGSNNVSGSNNDSGNDSHTDNHSYHGYGNIGITSAQELFNKEVDVAKFNMYEHIADLFCSEFCIMVY